MQTKNLPHKTEERPMIYQVIPRLFTNMQPECTRFGTLDQNGSGKFDDYTPRLLKSIKDLGVTHIWYTGIIENATKTDFSGFGIRPDNPNVVKGEAGSPYAIKDYYDVAPAIAVDIERSGLVVMTSPVLFYIEEYCHGIMEFQIGFITFALKLNNIFSIHQ